MISSQALLIYLIPVHRSSVIITTPPGALTPPCLPLHRLRKLIKIGKVQGTYVDLIVMFDAGNSSDVSGPSVRFYF